MTTEFLLTLIVVFFGSAYISGLVVFPLAVRAWGAGAESYAIHGPRWGRSWRTAAVVVICWPFFVPRMMWREWNKTKRKRPV